MEESEDERLVCDTNVQRVNLRNCQLFYNKLKQCQHLCAYVREVYFDFCPRCHGAQRHSSRSWPRQLPGPSLTSPNCLQHGQQIFALLTTRLNYINVRSQDLDHLQFLLSQGGKARRTRVELNAIQSRSSFQPSSFSIPHEIHCREWLFLETLVLKELTGQSLLLESNVGCFRKLKHLKIRRGGAGALGNIATILR